MSKLKTKIGAVIGFAGIALLCIDGGVEILPMQVIAVSMIASALALSGAFRKENRYV